MAQTPSKSSHKENVPIGLLFALGALPVGILAQVLLAQAGFIASLSAYLMVYLAVRFYVRGAKSMPIKGLYWLIGLILLGIFLSLVAVIAVDGIKFYNQHLDYYAGHMSKLVFLEKALTRSSVWSAYTSTIIMSLGFAALGTFGTIRQLMITRKVHLKNQAQPKA